MAGTIFGLPLSQRVDLNGKPAIGWLLYLYQANTSMPVDSFQDQALTVLNPWPITADASGMMRVFWLADGSYRVRGTSADGSITYMDEPSVLALGASSGAAPSGGVDPQAIFQTGFPVFLEIDGTMPGFVRDNARTIGSATSGATERANADCQALFEWYWNNLGNDRCPVSGGRGASALADWSANKQIQTLDKRGATQIGLGAMGNSYNGSLDNVPIQTGSAGDPGVVLGENQHTLISAESPSHTHTGSGTTGGQSVTHTHTQVASVSNGSYSAGGSNGPLGSGSQTGPASVDHTHPFSFTTSSTGGDGEHNNVPLAITGTWFRKL
jgi:hypothetical protein